MSARPKATKAQQWAIAQAIGHSSSGGSLRSFDREADDITDATVRAMERRGLVRVFWGDYGHWSVFLVLPEGREAAKEELDKRAERTRLAIQRDEAEELLELAEEPR